MTKKIVVTSRSFSRNKQLRDELLQSYPNVVFNDEGKSLRGDELITFLEGADAAITALEKIDRDVLEACPQLKVISKYGVGYDMIDLGAMTKLGVRLGWQGGVNKRSVSELVISNIISLFRHVQKSGSEVERGVWKQAIGTQLTGKTVGIVGCGNVGKDLAVLLRAFDCKILVHDVRDFSDFYLAHKLNPVGLEILLKESDVVTLHLPLDESTYMLINGERLSLMKKHALLINAARGGLVDEVALKEMLRDGKLAGAAFDVFETEPPQDLELLALENFLVTPHIGGSSEEAILNMGRAAIVGLDKNQVPGENWPQ